MSFLNKLVNFNLVGLCLRQNSGSLVRDMLCPTSCRFLPTICSMSSRKNCLQYEGPRCSKKVLAQSECIKRMEKELKEVEKPTFKWEIPECCVNKCQNQFPRFDDLYYHMSDKTKGNYMRTWVECPQLMIVPKKVCQFEPEKFEYLLPPINPRTVEERPKTACSLFSDNDKTLMSPPKKDFNFKCVTVNLRICRRVRADLSCEVKPAPSNCKKLCAPRASYSECEKPILKPLRPKECRCLVQNPLCELLAKYTVPPEPKKKKEKKDPKAEIREKGCFKSVETKRNKR